MHYEMVKHQGQSFQNQGSLNFNTIGVFSVQGLGFVSYFVLHGLYE
jgi:hypothetical protein